MSLFLKTFLYMIGIGENPMPIPFYNDSDAFQKDWDNIGSDFSTALKKYETETSAH